MKFILSICFLFHLNLFGQTNPVYSFNSYTNNLPDSVLEIQSIYEYNEKNKNTQLTIIEQFYSNKQLKYSYMVNSNYEPFGLFREFYKQGKLKSIGTYYRGVIVGLYIEYFENGKLKSIGNYKNINSTDSIIFITDTVKNKDSATQLKSIVISSSPKLNKVGKWYYYNENGSLKKEEEW